MSWYLDRRRLAKWLACEFQNGRVDIFEVPDYQGPLINSAGYLPVVVRLHGTYAAIRRHAGKKNCGMLAYCEKRQLSIHRSWAAVSTFAEHLTRETFGLQPDSIRTIYPPVVGCSEQTCVLPELPGEFILFAGGNVSIAKGALELAKAARIVMEKRTKVHLVYAGPVHNPDSSNLEDAIREIVGPDLRHKIHFLGRLPQSVLHGVMRKSRVFAYPSTLDTFGLILAEAMLQRCPAVAYDSGPVPEFLEHEKTGLMVPAGDIRALSGAILRMLDMPDFAASIAEAAAESIRNKFSIKECVSRSLEYYRYIIALHKKS